MYVFSVYPKTNCGYLFDVYYFETDYRLSSPPRRTYIGVVFASVLKMTSKEFSVETFKTEKRSDSPAYRCERIVFPHQCVLLLLLLRTHYTDNFIV
jgi:hypothetical protein